MSVPDFQSFFLPMLQLASDGAVHTLQEAYVAMVGHFELSDTEQKEMLPSGTQVVYKNRIAWARTYLAKAMLLESPKRGSFRITERGKEVLAGKPATLRVNHLKAFPEFVAFHTQSGDAGFTKDAQQYVATIDPKVVLIDGNRLVDLMIDHNLGVSVAEVYEIKKIDSDFFTEG